jgi:hypothetical protein
MEGFADIEGPVRIGLWSLIGWIGLAVIVVAALTALVVYLIRRRPAASGPVIPERSPLEIALERLNRLQNDGSNMEADPFVVEVSDIVRYFLEDSLKLPAREQTSEEFLQALQGNGDLPKVLEQHMPDFLEQCDRVKFARQMLALAQREELLNTAGTVVRETDSELQGKLAGEGVQS